MIQIKVLLFKLVMLAAVYPLTAVLLFLTKLYVALVS